MLTLRVEDILLRISPNLEVMLYCGPNDHEILGEVGRCDFVLYFLLN